jgi:hypothetical protein
LPKIKETEMPAGFTRRENQFGSPWKPQVGDHLFGTIIAYKQDVKVRTQRGSTNIAIIRDGEGEVWSVFISAGLNGMISAEDVEKQVWIKRLDDTQGSAGRNAMKTYEVAVK